MFYASLHTNTFGSVSPALNIHWISGALYYARGHDCKLQRKKNTCVGLRCEWSVCVCAPHAHVIKYDNGFYLIDTVKKSTIIIINVKQANSQQLYALAGLADTFETEIGV